MAKIKGKIKKSFSLAAIVALLAMQILPLGARAASVTIPDDLVAGTAGLIANPGASNSASNDPSGLTNKQQAPQLSVSFSSLGSAQPGTKVTANAVPSFFNSASDTSKLYFTWYLKRRDCDLSESAYPDGYIDCDNESSPDKDTCKKDLDADRDKNSSCDLDGDHIVTVNDWKIAAAQVISSDPAANASAPVPSPFDKWNTDPEKNPNPKDAPNCYVQEPTTGLIYELRKVEDKIENPPSSDYVEACAQDNQTATCDVLNPDYDPATTPAANAQVSANIAWNAANPTAAQKTPTTIIPEVSPTKVTTQHFCAIDSSADSGVYCKIDDANNYSDLKNFKATVSCTHGGTAIFVKNDGSNLTAPATPTADSPATGVIFGAGNLCSSLTANPNSDKIPAWVSGAYTKPTAVNYPNPDPIFANVVGQSCADARNAIVNTSASGLGNSNANVQCTFVKTDDGNMCKHLFPDMPNTVTGLGIDKFTWIYSTGDQVGVVVEGDSDLPTKHADSSMMRMWAFSKNTCSALSDIGKDDVATGENGKNNEDDTGVRGFYLEGAGGTDCDLNNIQNCTGFLTAQADLNDCLQDNLIDPNNPNADTGSGAGSAAAAATIPLNATPTNPLNDPTGQGDILKISADTSSLQNSNGLLYTWTVQKSSDESNSPIDTTSWQDITTKLEAGSQSLSQADAAGIGKSMLSINLNISDASIIDPTIVQNGNFYLRAKVAVTNASGQNVAAGISDPIKVNEQKNTTQLYDASADPSGKVNIATGASPICTDMAGQATCNVTKNEIVAMRVCSPGPGGACANASAHPLTWTINGNAAVCAAATSTDCAQGNILFFPILGNVGEAVDATGTGVDSNNAPISVTRHFVIVDPVVQIVSADGNAWPKLLGYYKALGYGGDCSQGSASCTPDFSSEVLQTNSGNTVTLVANTFGQPGFDWEIDGQTIDADQDKPQITIPIDKFSGDSYNIGLTTRLDPASTAVLSNKRLALNNIWGVSPDDAIEETQSANIQMDVIDGGAQALSVANPTTFGASLITHLSAQLFFLLKISLTAFGLLLAMGILFTVIPEGLFEKTE